MATVRLADVIEPEVYLSYDAVDTVEKTLLYEAGVIVTSPMLTEKANSGGDTVNLPFWNDLDATDEPDYSSDDPSVNSTPSKITAGRQIARLTYVNKSYQATDLAGEIAGSNPMQQIRNRFGTYWQRQRQRRLVAMAVGVQAGNVANDSSDMVNDISGATNADVASTTLFSRSAFTKAAFTLGDEFQSMSAIAVHSVVYNRMVDNDDIVYIPDSEGRLVIPTFMGRRVIIDDGMPVTPAAGTNSGDAAAKYTSVLFGEGAFGYGEGSATVPVEVHRTPLAANGGGVETIIERNTWLFHPFGFQTDQSSITVQSATLAELRTAALWDRVVPRKNVPLAFLVTNG